MAGSSSYPFLLSSLYRAGENAAYTVTLSNRSGAGITGFTLGFSGPGRFTPETPVEGATIVHQVSNWIELAPPKGFVLADGADWVVTLSELPFALKHWTDGAVAGVVALNDGSVHPTVTAPNVLEGNERPYKRGTMRFDMPKPAPAPISVVPWPQKVDVSGRRTAPDGLAVLAVDKLAQEACLAFAELTQRLFPGEALVRPLEEGGYRVDLVLGAGFGDEAYAITFGENGAKVSAATRTGFLYGLITLGQILRGARPHLESLSFPLSGTIEDNPYLSWRGCHWDVARRFFSAGEVGQFLSIMAWNKLNRFHWHLSDDEAWRIEIDAYPELTTKAAWRGYGMLVPPQLGSGPEPHGGFYTKAVARELIALGEMLGIEIVPEIDVPGHCYALLQALPQLKDPGENGLYYSIQGFPNNSLNPAVPAVYAAIETIFGELCALFPSKYFHIGADEVPHEAWFSSPRAKALLAEKGASEAAVLQAHFLRQVQSFLTSKGKITGAWEEAADGGGIDKADCYLVGWKKIEANQQLAAAGYDVVIAPGQVYYLDMANSTEWHEPGANWAGNSNPEETYGFTPGEGWSAAELEKLMGVQTCIWCEPMTERAVFDRLVFPRLSAMAETGWTRPERKDFKRFAALSGLMPNLYSNWEH